MKRVALVALLVALLFGVGGYVLGQGSSAWDAVMFRRVQTVPTGFTHVVASTYRNAPVLFFIDQPSGQVWVYQFLEPTPTVPCQGNAPFPGAVCRNGGWVPGA